MGVPRKLLRKKPKSVETKARKKAIDLDASVDKDVDSKQTSPSPGSFVRKPIAKKDKVKKLKIKAVNETIDLDTSTVEPIVVSNEDIKPHVKNSTIKKALNVLNQLSDIMAKKKKELLPEESSVILQIDCIKIPQCVSRKLRFTLPHWLVTESSEVCLFVKDLKKGKRIDHEPTIEHYEDLLKEKGITMIKSIVPVRQVRVEYDQMEMRRRLLTQFDFFLTDARVSGLLAHKLGMTFFRKKQLPTPLKMDAADLKKEIENALHKTVMNLHGTGNTYSLKIANNQHSVEDICQNVQAVLLQIAKQFPGGWENIRSIHLKNPLSMAIPIYITLKNKNNIKRTVIKPLHKNTIVSGELSTILNSSVRVHSDGKVFIKRKKNVDENEGEEVPSKVSKSDEKDSIANNQSKKSKDIVKSNKKNNKVSVDVNNSSNDNVSDDSDDTSGDSNDDVEDNDRNDTLKSNSDVDDTNDDSDEVDDSDDGSEIDDDEDDSD